MQKWWLMLLTVLMCSACQQIDFDEFLTPEDEGEGFATSFVMGLVSQEDFALSKGTRTARPVGEVASIINLAIFDGETKIKSVNQKVGEEDFGKITVNLPEGEYRVVAVAHNGSGNATITSPEKIAFPNNKTTDTFVYYDEITVSGKSEHDACMTRVVAMFRMVMLTDIPEEVKQLKFYYTGGSSTLDAVAGEGCVNSRQTEIREVADHKAGQVFEVYTFPHDVDGWLKMTITALGANDEVLHERTIEDVPVTVQKITVYSCDFFSGWKDSQSSDGQSFPLYADDTWRGELQI